MVLCWFCSIDCFLFPPLSESQRSFQWPPCEGFCLMPSSHWCCSGSVGACCPVSHFRISREKNDLSLRMIYCHCVIEKTLVCLDILLVLHQCAPIVGGTLLRLKDATVAHLYSSLVSPCSLVHSPAFDFCLMQFSILRSYGMTPVTSSCKQWLHTVPLLSGCTHML